MTPTIHSQPAVAIIGGGPAGLMAADVLSAAGVPVAVYDAMRTVGRKFLLAGKGGLNLTHAEGRDAFVTRYGSRQAHIAPLLDVFGPDELRQWAHGLGIETFVGSSGRVFPLEMKAAPLLRAWLRRLRAAGVSFHVRHRWVGWDVQDRLRFETPDGEVVISAETTILALGGGSWAKLGSDGAWVPWLRQRGIAVAPLLPSNCGFDIAWSDHFRERFAGAPLKSVVLRVPETPFEQQGECVVTATGIEGSLIYAASALLRDAISADSHATLLLDLAPQRTEAYLRSRLAQPRGSRSLANHLRKQVGITGVKAGLLREVLSAEALNDPAQMAATIKALPLTLLAPRPLDEAISSAGGVLFDALDDHLMVKMMPGLFCAGEMLDWEAPTGGYLLTACFASGVVAAQGALRWLAERHAA